MKLYVFIIVLVLGLDHVSAQNFESAISRVAPSGVYLGLDSNELKATRPDVFEGPLAATSLSSPSDAQEFPTYMEVQGMGKPGHVSYWYLLSENKVVGVLKTTNLVGVDEEVQKESAQSLFRELASLLGHSRQESILRRGETGFVPVRADFWKDPDTGTAIYFIATDKEITVAALSQSNFPIGQILISPDAQRFPLENPTEVSIRDLERPETDDPSATQAAIQTTFPQDTRINPSAADTKAIPQPTKQPDPNTQNIYREEKEIALPIVIAVGAAILVSLAAAAFFYIRHSR